MTVQLTWVDPLSPELILDNPATLNAMTLQDWTDCHALLERAAADPQVRRLVVRGSGRAFSAGADILFLEDLRTMNQAARRDALKVGSDLIRALIRFPAPTVAVVQGACFGVGASLALACDRIVAAPSAKFGFVFTGLGVPGGDMAASWLLSRRLGTRRASLLLSGAEVVSAERALSLGLVDEVSDSAQSKLSEDPVGRLAPNALRLTKRQILEFEGAFAGLDALLESQLSALVQALGEAEFAEGLSAIKEKRTATF